MKLPHVTTKRLERGRLEIRVHRERVGEVFPVKGGWQWRVESEERGIPPKDTAAEHRNPYLAQGEAQDAALKYVRRFVKLSEHAA